jgi:Mg2+ and Co2+ transporter CorA
MPAVKAPNGFWLICGYMMVAAVAVLIFFFQRGWLKAEK